MINRPFSPAFTNPKKARQKSTISRSLLEQIDLDLHDLHGHTSFHQVKLNIHSNLVMQKKKNCTRILCMHALSLYVLPGISQDITKHYIFRCIFEDQICSPQTQIVCMRKIRNCQLNCSSSSETCYPLPYTEKSHLAQWNMP